MAEQLRIIISGGGTGGHIFPAVSIAREIQSRYPQARILFVGAEGRMEMDRVPAAGFPIEGIRIAGFQRKKLLANLSLPGKIWSSLKRVRAIMERERPHLVIGTGGYVSGPTLWVAQRMGIPTLIQEQNSFAGWTNRWLSKKAGAICVAYPGMESAFPADRIRFTGNPVRPDLATLAGTPTTDALRADAKLALGFDPIKPLVLILGGSQGARAINELRDQTEAVAHNKPVEKEIFPHQIAFNVIPQVDAFLDTGYTKEEMKMENEEIEQMFTRAGSIVNLGEKLSSNCSKTSEPQNSSNITVTALLRTRASSPMKATSPH